MIKEEDILKLRLHTASKFISERIIYRSTGARLSLSPNEIIELLSILNPKEPFSYSEHAFVEPKEE